MFICYILVVRALITNRSILSNFCVHLNPPDFVELFQSVTVIAKFDRVRTATRFVDIQALFVNEVQGDSGELFPCCRSNPPWLNFLTRTSRLKESEPS